MYSLIEAHPTITMFIAGFCLGTSFGMVLGLLYMKLLARTSETID
jgi:tetrahydromethanopterin S-methyltransferase subunit B